MVEQNPNGQALIDLLNNYLPQFGSIRKMAQASDLSHSTISGVFETGRGTANVLIALADLVGERRVRLLVLGGVLAHEDLDHTLDPAQDEVLGLFNALTEEGRRLLLGVAREMLGQPVRPN